MRRMIPQKQIDKIDTLFQFFKLTPETLPPLPSVPNSLVFNHYIDDFAQQYAEETYEVDFENHVITGWYPTIEDSAGLAEIYFDMNGDGIPFPETINTVEDLIAWINIDPIHLIMEQYRDGQLYIESYNSLVPYLSIELDTEAEMAEDSFILSVDNYGYDSSYISNMYITTAFNNSKFKLTNTGVLEATSYSNKINGHFEGSMSFNINNRLRNIIWNVDKSQGTFTLGVDLSKKIWEIILWTHTKQGSIGSERAIDYTILGNGAVFGDVIKFPSITDGGYWQLNFSTTTPLNENYTITIAKYDNSGNLVPNAGDNTELQIYYS